MFVRQDPGPPPPAGPSGRPPYLGPIRRVHVLGHPSRALDRTAFPADAQVLNCHNFCTLLDRAGIPFVYYGLRGSRVPGGGELADLGAPTGPWEYGNPWHREYTRRLDAALARNLSGTGRTPQLLVSLYGCAQMDLEAPDRFDLPVVEAMVGYDHCWAPFRVFPSYAHQHAIYASGADHVRRNVWFDAVIPHFLDPREFWITPPEAKADYVLYLGRNTADKGVPLAEDVCRRAGLPLRKIHDGVSGEAKTRLISRARALIAPTLYVEPFGYVAVEAQMCGVPVVCTDWGAFVETVEQGVSGFRCRTGAEFLAALRRVEDLNPETIRNRALQLYSIDSVLPAYCAYFDTVWEVHENGFYAERALRLPFRG